MMLVRSTSVVLVISIAFVLVAGSNAQTPSTVIVSLDCGEAKRLTGQNNTPATITISGISSLVRPTADSASFQATIRQQPPQVPPSAPFNQVFRFDPLIVLDDDPAEGVKLETSVGTFTVLCSQASATFQVTVTPPLSGDAGLASKSGAGTDIGLLLGGMSLIVGIAALAFVAGRRVFRRCSG